MIIKKEVKMKHTKFALGAALLILAFLLVGCPRTVGGEIETTYTVTFIANSGEDEIGHFSYHDQESCEIKSGSTCEAIVPSIYAVFEGLFTFSHYTEQGTNTVFDFSTPITKNLTLVANYELIIPDCKCVATNDGTGLNISLNVSYSSKGSYIIEVYDESNTRIYNTETTNYWFTDTISDLEPFKEFTVKTYRAYNGQKSKERTLTAYTSKKTKILMMMYMDGDNNLNDPIFLDLNEAEYGLGSYTKEDTINNVKVIALWDGWEEPDGAEQTHYFDHPASRLLELGPETTPVYQEGSITESGYKLSENTIDRSNLAPWLASGEVDMSNKQTLLNFLNQVQKMYRADVTILQFSNHGGGPRSYTPRTAILPNGKEIKLNSMNGRRSMCWDESSGGKTFLKTSDISWALKEAGFSKDKQFDLIIEDVCLGSSIEEAYELRDYTDLFLASPNNVPGNGLDYTVLVKEFENGLKYSSTAYIIATDAVEQYAIDYTKSDSFWLQSINKYCKDKYGESFTTDFTSLSDAFSYGDNSFKSDLANFASSLSLYSDVSTISLISPFWLTYVAEELDEVVDEIFTNGGAACTKIFWDNNKKELTTEKNADDTIIISRLGLLSTVLTPLQPIYYQGTYSWLYDLGWVLDGMSYYAGVEGWTQLQTKINNVYGYLSNSIRKSWRDGCYLPSYYTEKDTWLTSKTSKNYYGLTISGETFAARIEGDTAYIINGNYPSWYTELAFGRDCKWNDLLKALYPAE